MSTKKADPIALSPEQTDPMAYELDALQKYVNTLVKESDSLDALNPSHQERIYLNLMRLEQANAQVKELAYKIELRAKPSPARERYLRLVWDREKMTK